MNKKPEIFKPEMDFIDNNKKAYYSFLEDRLNIKPEIEEKEVSKDEVTDFINKLSKSEGYIFNKNIVIETKNKKYDTKIAGKIGNRLITLDNDSININDITKIYEK